MNEAGIDAVPGLNILSVVFNRTAMGSGYLRSVKDPLICFLPLPGLMI